MPKELFIKTLSIFLLFIIMVTSLPHLTEAYQDEDIGKSVMRKIVMDFRDMELENYPHGLLELDYSPDIDDNDDLTLNEQFTTHSTSGELGYSIYMDNQCNQTRSYFDIYFRTSPNDISNWDTTTTAYSMTEISFDMDYISEGDGFTHTGRMRYYNYNNSERDDDYIMQHVETLEGTISGDGYTHYAWPVRDVGAEQSELHLQFDIGTFEKGSVRVFIDNIQIEYRTTEITPWLYNKFTGLGIEREKLRMQYKDIYGEWNSLGYDPEFKTLAGVGIEMRVLDYWGQKIWSDEIFTHSSEVHISIPIPLLDVEMRHEEEWGTPNIEINSKETGMSRHIQSYNFEIIGGRTYDFIWRDFDKFLNGSSEISFAYGEVQPDGSIETPDKNISNIIGGSTMLDLDMSIDPEYYQGMPPLDWSDPLKLTDNLAAGIGYLWFGLDYSDWRVYQDPVWPDWFAAVSNTSTGRATVYVITFIGLVFWLYWILRLRNERRRLDMLEEEVQS